MKHIISAALCVAATSAAAQEVGITADVMSVTVQTPSGPVEISRIQDQSNTLSGEFAMTSRPCPNFCIQPMSPAEGVRTVGELEVLAALEDPAVIVIDSRIRPDWEGGTIPGAINIPYNEMSDRLFELGCEEDFDGWLCEEAGEILLFCNGPWCGQSPTAIRRIIEAGYPAEKISYYRGGMQVWRMLGLTVAQP